MKKRTLITLAAAMLLSLSAFAADLTVDELSAKVGVPTRTIRFYTGKKLLPPPRLEGRTGLYGPAHVARQPRQNWRNSLALT